MCYFGWEGLCLLSQSILIVGAATEVACRRCRVVATAHGVRLVGRPVILPAGNGFRVLNATAQVRSGSDDVVNVQQARFVKHAVYAAGGGRDLNCPKCKGVDKRPCWCAEAGLRSVKQVELGRILALLPEVENSIKFYDNDNPYSTTVAPAQVLSYVQLAEVLRRERAYVRGHTCAMKRGCKVNWLQPNVPGAVEHTTTSVLLTAYDSDSSRRTSGREIHRVGSDQFIDIGSFGDGVRDFNWDAGQRALINKAS